ncbi:DUF2076 domain-containing protein [Bosea vestrisii]|uniref:DUF2076 domain-containing protein n=1 Tax=Bosea vestrisii TaxID=151416 RepID=UPI0024DFD171|nr:DUF2076 domain-containing protein [Bosea vestrisii]WID99575.1 DUF2076 domain-containing protein [Bosea vestrisii]
MTPQERDVIAGIFDRLRQAANQPRDPEAERFIADRLREQPYAVYAMAQSVYVQEQALTSMQGQIEQLQAEVEQLRNQPPAPAPRPAIRRLPVGHIRRRREPAGPFRFGAVLPAARPATAGLPALGRSAG